MSVSTFSADVKVRGLSLMFGTNGLREEFVRKKKDLLCLLQQPM